MSNSRSSRRTSARIATFHVDDEIEISSSLVRSDSLGDRVSGAGPPALSSQGDTDLTEAPGSIAHNGYREPSFNASRFSFAVVDDAVIASGDRWAKKLVGKSFKYKQEELEDDVDFKLKRPTNAFTIYSIVAHHAEKTQFLSANLRYARENLHYICYSVDAMNDYEIMPVASFQPALSERHKLYQLLPVDEESAHGLNYDVAPTMTTNEQFGDYTQGVHSDSSIFNLTPRQMGALLTFAPPRKGYVTHGATLCRLRKSFALVLKKLIDRSLSDEQLNGWSNLFMRLPCMFSQREGNKPDVQQRENFYLLLQNEDVANSFITFSTLFKLILASTFVSASIALEKSPALALSSARL